MKRLFEGLAVLLVLMVIGVAVSVAQETTPTPEATDEAVVVDEVVALVDESALATEVTYAMRDSTMQIIVVIGATIGSVVLILAALVAKLLSIALDKIYMSVPSHYRPAFADVVDRGTQQLIDIAKTLPTPFEFDDVIANKLRELAEPIIRERLQAIQAQTVVG